MRMQDSQASSPLGNTPLSSGLLASWSTTRGEVMEDILAPLSQGEGMEDILTQSSRLGREDEEDDFSLLENSSFGMDKAVQSVGESNLDTTLRQGGGSPPLGSPLGGEIVFQSRSVKAQGRTPAP
jgi:hypothetical protein